MMTRKFKVVLLRPPIVQLCTNLSSYGAVLPIGLSYIAAVLRQAGHEVVVIDAPGEAPHAIVTRESPIGALSFQGLTPRELVERIPPSAEILGLTHMFLHEWPIVREIVELAKKRFPKIVVVLGGENATAFWRTIFTQTHAVDYCILGEGEDTAVELLEDLALGRDAKGVPGIARHADGPAQEVPPRSRIMEVERLPRPAWDLFRVENYLGLKDTYGVDRGRSMPILASRGCPFKCTFCSSAQMWTGIYIARSPAEVVAEIRDYVEKYRIENMDFFDLTAIVRKDWILEFCELLSRESFKVVWQLPAGTRSEALDEEVLSRMYRTGCRNITYAPESGSPRMLHIMRKKVDLQALLRSLRSAVRCHLVTRVNIIIGHPREVRKDTLASLFFLIKAAWFGCDDAAVMIFSPYPGSEDATSLMQGAGSQFGEDYCYLSLERAGWSSSSYNRVMGTKELILSQYAMLLVFYAIAYLTRPRRIWKTLRTFVLGRGESTQLDQLLRTKFKKRTLS